MCKFSLVTVINVCFTTVEGNTYANSGDYKKAIDCFTEAIRLDSRDHRFVFCSLGMGCMIRIMVNLDLPDYSLTYG